MRTDRLLLNPLIFLMAKKTSYLVKSSCEKRMRRMTRFNLASLPLKTSSLVPLVFPRVKVSDFSYGLWKEQLGADT